MARTIAIFGMTGRTGEKIAALAFRKGWGVRGLVRDSSRLPENLARAKIIRGDFGDNDRVLETIVGSDAVCCVFGPRTKDDVFCARATERILAAIKETGCRRLICQTGAMIGQADNRSMFMDWMARMYARLQPQGAKDREEQERLIHSSDLEWTIIKPPRLTDYPPMNNVQASTTLPVGLMSSISRTDLATFIVRELEFGKYLRKRVFVAGRLIHARSHRKSHHSNAG